MAIPALSGAETFLNTIERAATSSRERVAVPTGLPPTLAADYRSGTTPSIALRTGRELVDKASSAAKDVASALDDLLALARQAGQEGYLAGVPDISRLTLSADARALVDRIDRTVRAASADGYNLVAGEGRDLRIATTGLGGAVSVATFGLDSRSLGLDRLDLTTSAGVADAQSRVAAALASVTVNGERIESLARAFGVQDSFVEEVHAAVASQIVGSSYAVSQGYGADGRNAAASTPRGTMVNLRV